MKRVFSQTGSSLLGVMAGLAVLSIVALGTAGSVAAGMRAHKLVRARGAADAAKATLTQELTNLAEDAFHRPACDDWEAWIRARAAAVDVLGSRPLVFVREEAELDRLPGGKRPQVRALCTGPRFPMPVTADRLVLCFALRGRAAGSKAGSFLNGGDGLVVMVAHARDVRSGVPLDCGGAGRRQTVEVNVDAEVFWQPETSVDREARERLAQNSVVSR